MSEMAGIPKENDGPRNRVDMGSMERALLGGSGALAESERGKTSKAVEDAIAEAQAAANPVKPTAAVPPPPPPAEPTASEDAGPPPPPPPAT
jgi:hypothetical protein